MKTESYLNFYSGHRKILAEFIEKYRNEPSLWNTKCPEYRDKIYKDAAYERLVAKLKELDSTADREKVVKKINSLRTNWRKEKKRVFEANARHPYKPRLWYYYLFEFLNDFDSNSTKSEATQDEMCENYEHTDECTSDYPEPLEYEELHSEEPTAQEVFEEYQPQIKKTTEYLQGKIYRNSQKKAMKRHSNISEDDSDASYENPATSHFIKRTKVDEDRHDVFGHNVAMKLRHISDNKQRILAEKLINDALFMAEIGELNMEHGINSFNVQTQPGFITIPEEDYEPTERITKIQTSDQELQYMSRSLLQRK